ncbi:MAG: ferritin-like domain-containing protein [Alphaproteobacteria bacterium]|nr:ferritin-like domain-containing protein [Alphaproteobacteria bacterium]
MATEMRYVLPVEQTGWATGGHVETVFRWDYDKGREQLLTLYDKGKKQQWDAAERIDWSLDLDPENPMLLPDQSIAIYGTPMWQKLNHKERANLRRHAQSWQISQFLHGEQGALVCTSKIVQEVPALDAKFYAATQVMDEARHVEAYSRLLREKFELAFPINPHLKTLLDQILRESRWDFTYLGMQVLVEGLALAAFQRIRDISQNPLAGAVNAYVMQDEARHVAFGRIALRDYYPELTQAERNEREEFAVAACWLMRDRFLAEEVWEACGLPVEACVAHARDAEPMQHFRGRLFSRIVPTLKDIGLWGPKIQECFTKMGVMDLANLDSDAMLAQDDKVAADFDKRMAEIRKVAAAAD